jgi:alpha-D-xyloside xylohydrolase
VKFTDGQWLTKPNFTFLHPQQVFDVDYDGNEMTVYVYTQFVEGRSQTLDQGTITFHFTSDQKDTIRIKASHYEGIRKKGPEFDIIKDGKVATNFEEFEDVCCFTSGKLKAVVTKLPFSIDYFYDDKKITGSPVKAIGNIKSDSGKVYMREQLTLSVGEYVYGLGERFTSYLKNGQVVDMWNEDGGTASELTYKNIPFYITNKNYGVFVQHTEKVSFEVASEQVERVQFSVPGEQLEYTIIGGSSMGEVISNYTNLTGKPALPPAWSFGLWLTTSFTTSYDEETVNSFIDGMSERDIPLHVFHFDCFWMEECQWCNFKWDPHTFPDPEGMLKRLKEKGLKICVWINPYIAQKSELFKEGMENHYLVEYLNGDVWQWDRWQAGMGLVDFTNPDASRWYQDKLKVLLDMGVDCFKTDFGERIPTDVVYYDGSDPIKMHNYYTHLYNKCVFDLLKKVKGKNEAAVFARSATAGGQQFPIHWGGDCWGTYESMAESLRAGLSLCMSGFGFWSHDISGFEKTATPDLYKRWVAFGLLSTHSRLHGSTSYRVPWLFDEESVDVLRFFTNLRCQMMPYLWHQANITASTGYPMLRNMVLEFNEPACRYLDSQYMLGENLLVAPIFNEEGKSNYYLPKGTWMDFFTGEMVEGGTYYEGSYDYLSLPLYVRPNSILPISTNVEDVVYDYTENLTLHVTSLEDGKKASCIVNKVDTFVGLEVTVERTGNQYIINNLICEKPYELLFRGLTHVEEAAGAKAEVSKDGVVFRVDSLVKTITFSGK